MNSPSPLNGPGTLPALEFTAVVRDFLLTLAIPLDMRRAALIRQDLGRPYVLRHQSEFRRSRSIMTQAAFSTTLSAEEIRSIEVTAAVWRSRGHAKTADNLLLVAGLTPPAPVIPQNVFHLADYRRAVQR